MARKPYLVLSTLGSAAVLTILVVLLASANATSAQAPTDANINSALRAGHDAFTVASEQVSHTLEVIATGLYSPRGLTFASNGDLYVTEAGMGGTGPCWQSPLGEQCYGTSGAVTRVSSGMQQRVVTGLSSIGAGTMGNDVVGPHDVTIGADGTMYALVGLGADPAIRDMGGTLSLTTDLGHIITFTNSGTWAPIVDVAAYEASSNPDGGHVDSNPFDFLTRSDGSHAVADAGANDLLNVDANGTISTMAVFGARLVTNPFSPTQMIPMEAVPTAVAMGPDGAYYIGQLTGFPFPAGGANVYRLAAGEITATVYLTGFSSIVDLAFGADGSLYVLEMFTNGMMSGDPTGAITRIAADGTRGTLASDGLFTPAKMTVGPDHALYVSNYATMPGQGQVVRVPTPLSENTIYVPIIARNR